MTRLIVKASLCLACCIAISYFPLQLMLGLPRDGHQLPGIIVLSAGLLCFLYFALRFVSKTSDELYFSLTHQRKAYPLTDEECSLLMELIKYKHSTGTPISAEFKKILSEKYQIDLVYFEFNEDNPNFIRGYAREPRSAQTAPGLAEKYN